MLVGLDLGVTVSLLGDNVLPRSVKCSAQSGSAFITKFYSLDLLWAAPVSLELHKTRVEVILERGREGIGGSTFVPGRTIEVSWVS